MGRGRDQADAPLLLTAGPVVAADRQQPGELALRAGVGLDRDPVVAGDGRQPALQLLDQLVVAGGVLGGREGVQAREARQPDRLHLGGGVELHGARAQRDHAAVQRVVASRQPRQVAQHRGLGAVRGEHLVGQVVGGAAQLLGQPETGRRGLLGRGPRSTPKARQHGDQVLAPRGLRDRDPDVVVVDLAQVDAGRAGGGDDVPGAARHGDRQGVEERLGPHLEAAPAQRVGQQGRLRVGGQRDPAQPVGAVVDGVHRGHDGQQDLGGADVGGRLVAADVLLAGLQREAVRRTALGVDRDAHEAAGQVTLQALARRP